MRRHSQRVSSEPKSDKRRGLQLKDSLSILITFQGTNLKSRGQSNLIKIPQQKGISLGPRCTPPGLQWHAPPEPSTLPQCSHILGTWSS